LDEDKSGGDVCPSNKLFVRPRVAYSVKGEWLYVVNFSHDFRQGVIVQECA
jgi:hypothetical protein